MTLRSPELGAAGAVSPGVFEPDRGAAWRRDWRVYMQRSCRPGMQPGAGLHAGGSRSAAYAECWIHGESACAYVVCDQCLLRVRVCEWAGGVGQGPYQGPYLPVHTTFDVSAGHALGERWKVSASVLNVTNHRVLLDNSITIGGFHWNDPRMISAEVRYRFHF